MGKWNNERVFLQCECGCGVASLCSVGIIENNKGMASAVAFFYMVIQMQLTYCCCYTNMVMV